MTQHARFPEFVSKVPLTPLTVAQFITKLSKLPPSAELHYVATGEYDILPICDVDADVSEDGNVVRVQL